MSNPECPKCGEEHNSNYRYCSFCGEDLEEIILAFKEKKLPISFNNGNNKSKEDRIQDEAEERRQAVMRIKEQKREQERIVKVEDQRKREEYLEQLKSRNIPTRKTHRLTYVPPVLMLAIILVAVALLNTDIYGDSGGLIAFYIIVAVGSVLFILSFIPVFRVTALIRSKGLTTKLRQAPKRERDELDECLDCCSGPCWI